MKKIYEFTVNKTEEIEEKIESTNETGAKVITINKVTKPVPHKFAIIKMTRSLKDDADLFFGREYGRAIQKGMVPMAILSKRFENDDGIFGEKTVDLIKKLSEKLVDLFKEKNNLEVAEVKDNNKISLNNIEIKEIQNQLRDIEIRKNSYFSNTADVWARNKTLIWWLLHLSYSNNNDKLEPFFKGADYESKLADYDNYVEKDEAFYNEVVSTFLTITSLYYSTGATSQSDYERMLKELNEMPPDISS